ncbi:hypothetical protein EDB83DRAFT_2316318 [Lactarius deliciosus]|nr:hypothetical protein EDB83DRAFT_2316318 [Lactarius deliciosus]
MTAVRVAVRTTRRWRQGVLRSMDALPVAVTALVLVGVLKLALLLQCWGKGGGRKSAGNGSVGGGEWVGKGMGGGGSNAVRTDNRGEGEGDDVGDRSDGGNEWAGGGAGGEGNGPGNRSRDSSKWAGRGRGNEVSGKSDSGGTWTGQGVDSDDAGDESGGNGGWAGRGIGSEDDDMVWASDRPGSGSKDAVNGGKGAGEDRHGEGTSKGTSIDVDSMWLRVPLTRVIELLGWWGNGRTFKREGDDWVDWNGNRVGN